MNLKNLSQDYRWAQPMPSRHARQAECVAGSKWIALLLLAATVLPGGCTRTLYRRQADREAHYLVREKSVNTPWEVPSSYTIQPDPRSRFFDPTDADFPTLPPAGPQLYQYQLPELGNRRNEWQPEPLPGTQPERIEGQRDDPGEPELPLPPLPPDAATPEITRLPSVAPSAPQLTRLNPSQAGSTREHAFQSSLFDPNGFLANGYGTAPGSAPRHGDQVGAPSQGIQLAAYQQDSAAPSDGNQPATDPFLEFIQSLSRSRLKVKGLKVQPISRRFWDEIPANCLGLMLDFESVRVEYSEAFNHEPGADLLDDSPRMTLPDLFELALINSRDYQRQKELLYQAALDVALQRFAYATKLSVRGATVDTTYTHARFNGTTVNTLAVPSTFSGDKALATGGTLVGRFANDVLLTFNGPRGFAADISTELLFDITQRVFQRDILLEPLIQSERNLVYQARDFARFRKQFFLDVSDDYYNVIRNYRRIEIAAQNYFARVRTFQQAAAEVESGVSSAPNVIFLNQFERSALQALASLIRDCNTLEQLLDNMKITIGVPTETKINVKLDELAQLTLRDMIEVNQAQAQRWLSRLKKLRNSAGEEVHSDILTADYSLSERLIKWLWERSKIAGDTTSAREIFKERAMFRLDAARLDLLTERKMLADAQTATPPKQRILILQHQVEVIESELMLIDRQLDYAAALGHDHAAERQDRSKWQSMTDRFQILLNAADEFLKPQPDKQHVLHLINQARSETPLIPEKPVPEKEQPQANPKPDAAPGDGTPQQDEVSDDEVIIALLDAATIVLSESETVSQDLDERLFGVQVTRVDLNATLERTDRLISFTRNVFEGAGSGLPRIDISVDEAMITALVQRLDLMNERGTLADNWRDIKFAADALKSNLTLSASQRIGTDTNRPFNFSTDNANTRLRVTWDLPVNRKAERNAYRRSLINYNAGLRNLMLFEDNIKRNVRREMRNLAQIRVQYPISVDVAALAQEQVISTQLQLILGIPGVRAADLLDAYNAARTALGDMVDARIGYITERARFAFELEVMMLDDIGYWPEINDPKYQPEPNGVYPWNAGAAYGTFPTYLKPSHELRRMLHYPPPGAHAGSLQRGEQPDLEATPVAK